jgi:hypothetical protein
MGKLFFQSTETIVINKAFALLEQMLYLLQWFYNVGFTDLIKYANEREWVKIT